MQVFLWTSFSIAVLLFLLSSFFAAAETALTAFSRPRIHRLAKKGNARAKRIEALAAKMNHTVGSILIGKNAMDILGTSLMTTVFLQLFNETGVVIATMLLTLFIIIFIEVMPKMYAISQPEHMSLSISLVMQWCVRLLSPLMYVVQIVSEKTLSLLGMRMDRVESWSSAIEELRSAIDLHGKERLTHESHMLHSVLDLSSLTVDEILIHRSDVMMVDVDQNIDDIHKMVLKSIYTRLPVWKNSPENIIGILNTKTFIHEYAKHQGKDDTLLDIKKVVSKPWFIPETTPLLQQMLAFRKERHHLACIIDEYGSFSGIVSLEDILEVIVGEIEDEHDEHNNHIRPTKDGAYLVEGTVTIRELNKHFNLEIPDEDFSTLAGLLIHESQSVPTVGQRFHFYGMHFNIVRKEDQQIDLVRLEILKT